MVVFVFVLAVVVVPGFALLLDVTVAVLVFRGLAAAARVEGGEEARESSAFSSSKLTEDSVRLSFSMSCCWEWESTTWNVAVV